MTTSTYTISDYASALVRRRKVFFALALPIVLGTLFYTLTVPDLYHSSSVLSINLEGPGAQALEPIALTTYADKYIGSIRDRVLRRDKIRNWITELKVFPAAEIQEDESEAIREMRENFQLEKITQPVLPVGSNKEVDVITGFRVGFNSPDPDIAVAVATALTADFLVQDRLFRTERASSTSTFLKDQLEKTEAEIAIGEQKLADFKREHACCLPELVEHNSAVIERTERDLENIRSDIRVLEKDRIFASSDLQELELSSDTAQRKAELELELGRMLATYAPDHPDLINVRKQLDALNAASPGSGSSSELFMLRAQLASAQLKYSPEHPDILGLKRRIAALEAEEAKAGGKARRNNSDPRYLQGRSRINSIDTELSSLRARAEELRSKVVNYEERLARTPQIESNYLALSRRLESARQSFGDLQQRRILASQTEALESTDTGARLTETQSPYKPSEPAWPPRVIISVIGAIFGFMLGIGGVLVSEMMDSTVRGSKDIIGIMEAVPIAAIPVVQNSLSRSGWYKNTFTLVGTVGLVVILAIAFAVSRSSI